MQPEMMQGFTDELVKIAGLLSTGLKLARPAAKKSLKTSIKASGNPAADFARLKSMRSGTRGISPAVAAARNPAPQRGFLSRMLTN